MSSRIAHVVLFALLLLITSSKSQAQVSSPDGSGPLYQMDVDGDGQNTVGDRELVLWWVFNGGDIIALQASVEVGPDGLIDLTDFFASPEAQIGPPAGTPPVATAVGSGEVSPDCVFIRGDINNDSALDISDPLFLLAYLFSSGPEPSNFDSADTNDDGSLNNADVVYLLNHLFPEPGEDPPPPPGAPFPDPGEDPTPDALEPACLTEILGNLEAIVGKGCGGGGAGVKELCFLADPPNHQSIDPGTMTGGIDTASIYHAPLLPLYRDLILVTPKPPTATTSSVVTGATGVGDRGAFGEFIGFTCADSASHNNVHPDVRPPVGPGNTTGSPAVLAGCTISNGYVDYENPVGFSRYGILDDNGIDWGTGGYHFDRSYLHIPGRGIDYEFTMSYRSFPRFVGGSSYLGVGWDHYYFQRIIPWFDEDGISSRGLYRIVEGQVEHYEPTATDPDLLIQVSEGYNRIRIHRDGSGNMTRIVLRQPNGLLFSFFPFLTDPAYREVDKYRGGKLQFVRDRHGNQITCEYENVTFPNDVSPDVVRSRVSAVIDTLGRRIDYSYNGNSLLSSVSYNSGISTRTVSFAYESPESGRSWPGSEFQPYTGVPVLLSEIKSPAVTMAAPGGQTYPNGKRLRFEYGSHFQLGNVKMTAGGFQPPTNSLQVDVDDYVYAPGLVLIGAPLMTHIYAEDGIDAMGNNADAFLRIKYDPVKARVTETVYGDLTKYQQLEMALQDCGAGGAGAATSASPQIITKVITEQQVSGIQKDARGGTTTYSSTDMPTHEVCITLGPEAPEEHVVVGPAEEILKVTRTRMGGGTVTANFDPAGAVQTVVERGGRVFGGMGVFENWQPGAQEADNLNAVLTLDGEGLDCNLSCAWVTYFKRNEKGQPVLTVYPKGNCKETSYDPVLGTVVEERLYESSLVTLHSTHESPYSDQSFRPSSIEPDGAYITLRKSRYEPLFAQMIEGWDPRNPDVVDTTVWNVGSPGYYSYGDMSSQNLKVRAYVDYQVGAGGLTPTLAAIRSDYDLPDPFQLGTPYSILPTPSGGYPSHVAAGTSGNVVLTTSPTASYPSNFLGQANSGACQAVSVYAEGGQLLTAINPEGVATTHTYYPANAPGTGETGLAPVQIYADLYGSGPLAPTSGGGFLHTTIHDDPSMLLSTGSLRVSPVSVVMGPSGFVSNAVASGRTTTFEYDQFGNLNKVTDPLSRVTTTQFNELNQEYQATNPLGFSTFKHYDELNNIVLEEFEHGWTDWDGTVGGDPVDVAGPDGFSRFQPQSFVIAYKYDFAGNLIAKSETYRDASGQISEADARTWLYFYSIEQRPILEISPRGNIKAKLYDPRGQLWAEIHGVNDVASAIPPEYLGGPDYPNGPNLAPELEQPLLMAAGVPSTFTLNPEASFVVYGYDSNKNLVCQMDAHPHGKDSVSGDVTAFFYDKFDRPERTRFPDGTNEHLFYDPASNVVQKGTTGGGFDVTMQRQYPDNLGDAEAKITASTLLGLDLSTTNYVFDEKNRQVQSSALLYDIGQTPDPAVGAVTTTYMDRLDAVLATVDPEGRETHAEFDRLGRTTRTSTSAVPGLSGDRFTAAWQTKEIAYDNVDRVVEDRVVERAMGNSSYLTTYATQRYDMLDRVIESVDTLGQTTRFRYDSRGNSVQATDARSGTTNAVSFTRATGGGTTIQNLQVNTAGNLADSIYDVFGRAVESSRPMTDTGLGDGQVMGRLHGPTTMTTHGVQVRTQVVYDLEDNPTRRIDDNGNITAYLYDEQNRRTAIVYPHPDPSVDIPGFDDNPRYDFSYDEDGLLESRTDELGTVTTYTYDIRHREVQRTIDAVDPDVAWEPTLNSQVIDFVYDGLNRVVWSSDSNNPDDANDDHHCIRIFDSLGRMTEEVFDGAEFVDSDYDLVGNKTDLGYPDGTQLDIVFDNMHRVSTISKNSATWADYSYAGTSRFIERNVHIGPRGVTTAAQFDSLGRLVRLQTEPQGGALLQDFESQYNRNNHAISETRHHEGRRDQWSYDSANRVIQEIERIDTANPGNDPGTVKEYWLDGVGNWIVTEETPPLGAIVTQVNEVDARNFYTTFNGEMHEADAGGNRVVGAGGRVYKYDGQKRLTSVEEAGVEIARYEYFADSRRALKVASQTGVTETYVYDGDRILEVISSGSDDYVYYYGRQSASPLTYENQVTGDEYLRITDPRGSTTLLLDDTNAVAERYDYDAYGRVTIRGAAGTQMPASTVGSRFLYVGYYHEPDIDHYWLKFRVYDPHTGRFLTNDPIGVWGDKASWGNGYGYGGFNPITFDDPLGLSKEEISLRWHHMLPQAIFDDEFFEENPHLKGEIDINDPKYGWIGDDEAHRAIHHPEKTHSDWWDPKKNPGQNWNDEWERWLDEDMDGKKVTKEDIEKKLKKMKGAFKDVLKTGVYASKVSLPSSMGGGKGLGYNTWKSKSGKSLKAKLEGTLAKITSDIEAKVEKKFSGKAKGGRVAGARIARKFGIVGTAIGLVLGGPEIIEQLDTEGAGATAKALARESVFADQVESGVNWAADKAYDAIEKYGKPKIERAFQLPKIIKREH